MNVLVVLLLRFWQGRGDAGGERAASERRRRAAAGEADATRSEVSNASLGT